MLSTNLFLFLLSDGVILGWIFHQPLFHSDCVSKKEHKGEIDLYFGKATKVSGLICDGRITSSLLTNTRILNSIIWIDYGLIIPDKYKLNS